MIAFDGRAESAKILTSLKSKPSLEFASLLIGEDKASKIYTNLKRQAAEEIGFKMHVFEFSADTPLEEIKDKIALLNKDENIKGIMIQLPLPDNLKQNTDELINLIDMDKDIDGLREDSKFTPATSRAIQTILKITNPPENSSYAFVGGDGTVGKAFIKNFKYEIKNFEKGDDLRELINYDVVISATGVASLIKPEMIKEGSVLIDVGAPRPEFDPECYKKASFYTPVPGGVGPMTIASLLQNAVDACKIA